MMWLVLLFFALTTSASFGGLTIKRESSRLAYSATVDSSCAISWRGVRGVWKLGDFPTSCPDPRLFATATAFVSRSPLRFASWDNATTLWVTLVVNGTTFDTRSIANSPWDQLLRDGIANVELMMDNVFWPVPDVNVFGKDRVQAIALQHVAVGGLLELYSNGTGFFSPADGSKRTIASVGEIWGPALAAYLECGFYAIESFPIIDAAPNSSVTVTYYPELVQRVGMSNLGANNPSRLVKFASTLAQLKDRVHWVDEGVPAWLANNGRTAAIVCAVIFGVMVLLGIVLVANKCRKPLPPKLTTAEKLNNAVMQYADLEDEEDEFD